MSHANARRDAVREGSIAQVTAGESSTELPARCDRPVQSAEAYRIPRVLHELLGSFGPAIEDCFRRMALAERALAQCCARHPRHAQRIDGAFRILSWRLPVRVTDSLYLAHVDELLQRVVYGHGVAEGTHAEVLVFLNSASLRAPLGQQAAALYAELFRSLLHTEALFENDKTPVEPWPGARAELLKTLCRDLRVADRMYPTTGETE